MYLCWLVNWLTLPHRHPARKHVMGQVLDVVPQPVVGIEECFHMPPRALDRVRMSERRRTWRTKLSLNSPLKPWTLPDWLGSRACRSRCDPPTPSWVTISWLVSTHRYIWDPHLQHIILLRIRPTSFTNWTATSGSLNRNERNNLLGKTLAPSVARPNVVQQTYGL
jgi:hypothetical protein